MDNTNNASAPRRSLRNAGKSTEDLNAAVSKTNKSSSPPPEAEAEKNSSRTTRSKGKGRRSVGPPAGEEDVDTEDAQDGEMGDNITVSPRISREISRMAGGMGPPPRPMRATSPASSPKSTRSNRSTSATRKTVSTPETSTGSSKKTATKSSATKTAPSTPMQRSNDTAENGEGSAPPTKASRLLKLKMTPKPKPDPSFEDYGNLLMYNIEGGQEMYEQQGGDEKFGTQEERVREAIANGLAERALAEIPDPVSSEDSREGDDEEGDQDGEDEGGEDDEEGAEAEE